METYDPGHAPDTSAQINSKAKLQIAHVKNSVIKSRCASFSL
jgi:hypothetical protein